MPSIGHVSSNFNIAAASNFGALEIAVFISLALCGIVAAQGYSYYTCCTSDRPFLKIMVGIILVLELSHSVTAAHAIYDFTITLEAVAVKPANSYSLSTTVVLETLITAIVQSFFAYRIRALSGNMYVCGVCWILCFLRSLGGIALAVESFLDVPHEPNYFVLQDTFGWLITAALSVGAAVDVLIAVSLCYYLQQLMTPVTMRRTARIVDRLITWTIQTGLVTSMASVAAAICFQTMKRNEVWLAIYIVLAKLYSNSLLLSLNVRAVNRTLEQAPPTTMTATSKLGTLEFAIQVTQPGSDGSHVHRILGRGARRRSVLLTTPEKSLSSGRHTSIDLRHDPLIMIHEWRT